jgi:hypothetical protein
MIHLGKTRAVTLLVVLVLLTSLAALSGCVSKGQALVRQKLSQAGQVERGTTASWVRGGFTAGEKKIVEDPNGQWAVTALASSSFGDVSYRTGWTPSDACGPPNVPSLSNSPEAWGPSNENYGYEWLDLSYATPVHATGVRIKEVQAVGCIVIVEIKDTTGKYHVKWKGADKKERFISWLVLDFPATDYLTDGVKITLDTTICPNWKEIDAVQLQGTP